MSSSMSGYTGAGGRANTGIGAPNPNAKSGLKSIPGHRTFQQFSPEQMQLFQHLFSQLGPESFLSKLAGGDESTFQQMEAPALKQFSALQGGLASRFSGMGMGARHSSGFQNTATQANSDFAQALQAQRTGLQQQALEDLMRYSQMLFAQQPYALREKREKQQSGRGSLIGAGGGALLGTLFGAPLQGAQLGYQAGSFF